MISYARIPIIDHVENSLFHIYFAARDHTNRERIFKLLFNIQTLEVKKIFKNPLLDFGENLGAFDDNGVTPCSLINHNKVKYLYYAGWNIHAKIPFTCAIGLAKSLDGGKTYSKMFKGAVIDRDKDDHQFVAVNDVFFDKDYNLFKTWYLSCIKWVEREGEQPLHFYHIKYAESKDGVNWKKSTSPSITFKNKHEYAISTPRVIKDGPNDYKMWYSFRGQQGIDTYRIGYAESKDGINWTRKDELMKHFDVSDSGWDSEMICYPCVFDHDGKRYMLYNGNGYGRTGFGLAVLEQG